MSSPAATRPRLLEPGLRLLPPGVERYVVRGNGVTVFTLFAGDGLELIDPQGRQAAEVVCVSLESAQPINLAGDFKRTKPTGIQTILGQDREDARSVLAALKMKNVALGESYAMRVLDGNTPPGNSTQLTADEDVICIVGAPGDDMPVDAQTPPTDLTAFVHRARIPEQSEATLPAPLADPRLDIHVDRCTAHAYEVKAGEFIQVIDVEGRECSDFQCFSSAQLDRGIEDCLDATTTRTLLGSAYPAPGLRAKFFDQNQQPLVEVIRDTCGRHDSFGLACTAKYYDDMGYPGHVNCSDNFNRALDPYGVTARRGWMALNLFFNTAFDDNNQLLSDEPWSRPGDYVLFRALQDMVCVTSACPDDIDAANAWNPTDIHVRVYAAKETFSRAIAFRMTTDAEPQLTKETPFHSRTAQHTRNFAEYSGYWLANAYTRHGAVDEYWACRERAAVIDLTPLRKYEVLGPDAQLLMQTCVTRNIARLAVGQVVYTAMCYETGGMIDDGTVFRLGQDNFRWIGGSDVSGMWLREQAQQRGLRAWVKNSTDQLCNLQVQGPNSRAILRDIVWTRPDQPAIDELDWFRFSIARINDPDGIPIIVSRTGYTGELGFEVFCHPKDAEGLWDAVWQAGEPHGLTPLGLEALDMLRIEAGLIVARNEFDDQIDPFEAGIPFTVPLKSKNEDFIGRDALLKRKASPQRVLIGLELRDNEPARHGDLVHIDRNQVGIVTSGTRSPTLGKNIALCRIAVEYSEIGGEVEVSKLDGHQKRIPATVVRFPFYDPDKTRVRDAAPE